MSDQIEEGQFHQECLVCSSRNLREMTAYQKDYLCKCQNCGFVFCKKVPSLTELNEYYSTYSYDGNSYLSPLTRNSYQGFLDQFELFRKTNRILDVGCGMGYFLEEAKKRGWETYGTEYSSTAVEKCREKGLNVYSGALNPNDFEKESFDVITSFEVIEHINNQQEEIKFISELTRKGGGFFCTTPNFNSTERLLLKEKYNVIKYPEHLAYFTRKTLKHLLSANHFSIKYVKTTGISLTRFKTSKGAEQKMISSTSDDEKLRVAFAKNGLMKGVKNLINVILSLFGVGTTLKGLFIKK